jgi:hypothetical protein
VTALRRFLLCLRGIFLLYILVSLASAGAAGALAIFTGKADTLGDILTTGRQAGGQFLAAHALHIWMASVVIAAAAYYRWKGLALGLVIAAGSWVIFGGGLPAPERVEEEPPVTGANSTPAPEAAPTTPASNTTPQQRAMDAFPALAVKNSPLNLEFVARYRRYKTENPTYFDDPEWPLKLAKESSEALAASQPPAP